MLISTRKATHWETYGVIMVLICLSEDSADTKDILQVLMAEGYETMIARSQDDVLASFSESNIFPDAVLIDSDLAAFGEGRQLIPQLQVCV